MLFMLSAFFGGKMDLIKNKKGHFDSETLIVAIVGGVIAYLILEAKTIKQLWKNKFSTKSEKNIRIRE